MKNSDRSARHPKRLGAALAIGLSASIALSACAADDPLAQQAAVGDNKNYIAGDGSVTEYAAGDRGEPLTVTGTQYDGTVVDSADWVGDVTVVNFWYAACAPCREEAPDLVALHDEYDSAGAQFYGVNIRDTEKTAEAFERSFEIPYPSLDDQDGGVLLAMTSYVPPQAVPTTLVIDKEGRVSARILGLADKTTLGALIDSALAE